jgi:hypothetical protein
MKQQVGLEQPVPRGLVYLQPFVGVQGVDFLHRMRLVGVEVK